MSPVTVEGADRLAATMNRAADELGRLEGAHRDVAALIARTARPPRRTGRLAASIRAVPDPAGARVEATVPYAGAVSSGVPARGIAGRPFLTDAVRAAEGEIVAIYGRAVQTALDAVGGA